MQTTNPVEDLVNAFGSIRNLLRAMGEGDRPNLVQHWQKAGRIPHYRQAQVEKAAKDHKVKLPKDLLPRLFPERDAA